MGKNIEPTMNSNYNFTGIENRWLEYYQYECFIEILANIIGILLAFIKLCIR